MGLFAALVDDEFLATLLLLQDVFAAIALLNLALQKSQILVLVRHKNMSKNHKIPFRTY